MANNNLLLDDDDDAAAAVYRFKNKEADEQQATMVDRRRPKNKKCIALLLPTEMTACRLQDYEGQQATNADAPKQEEFGLKIS